MKIIFASDEAFEDFNEWASNDKKMHKKLMSLIRDIRRNPYEGLGQSEPLKYNLSGYWSRRINHEHRLVYQIIEGENLNENTLIIISCKTHYDKDS